MAHGALRSYFRADPCDRPGNEARMMRPNAGWRRIALDAPGHRTTRSRNQT